MNSIISASSGSGGVGLIVIIALYFLPLIIASKRGVRNIGSITVINIFLGWTLIGWVVALAMACAHTDHVADNTARTPSGTVMPAWRPPEVKR